jgi:hypothetical protein
MEDESIFFEENNHFRCFAHIINLSVQIILNSLKNKLEQVNIKNFYFFKLNYIIIILIY